MFANLFVAAFILFNGPQPEIISSSATETAVADSITWISLEDLNKIVEKNIKKDKVKEEKLILVDFYTDWCGWCKKLDQITYRDSAVVDMLNTYFYAVKFDAESRDTVQFANKTYGFKSSGARGTNEFALAMATREGGRIGYPTMTIITAMGEKVAVEAGYKDPAKMLLMLRFYGEGHYKTMNFQTFLTQKPAQSPSPEFSD